MKAKTQCINFEIAKQLEEFISKKLSRLERRLRPDDEVEIRLTVIKPQTHQNKEAEVRIADLFAKKTADTFEEAITDCLEALDGQIEKRRAV